MICIYLGEVVLDEDYMVSLDGFFEWRQRTYGLFAGEMRQKDRLTLWLYPLCFWNVLGIYFLEWDHCIVVLHSFIIFYCFRLWKIDPMTLLWLPPIVVSWGEDQWKHCRFFSHAKEQLTPILFSCWFFSNKFFLSEGITLSFLFVLMPLQFNVWYISSYIVRLFAVVDDIFCLFQGHIENVALLKQQYGLNKTANEVIIIIEAYRTLRDRGPYPADQVVRDIQGKFAFILYDSASKAAFVAAVSKASLSCHSFFNVCFQVLVVSFFVPTGHLLL